jgi:hypothetical protein
MKTWDWYNDVSKVSRKLVEENGLKELVTVRESATQKGKERLVRIKLFNGLLILSENGEVHTPLPNKNIEKTIDAFNILSPFYYKEDGKQEFISKYFTLDEDAQELGKLLFELTPDEIREAQKILLYS